MDSTASRVLKARQYAEERDQRIKVHNFELELHGENANHTIRYSNGTWSCDCEEFVLRNVCAHVMAIEEILGETVEPAMMYNPSLQQPATAYADLLKTLDKKSSFVPD